jgi:3'(2'), 5'-bisphosphate nucleotidase
MVASGRASVFLLRAKTQRTIKSWDHAVGIICVHEAGGKVTDWEGDEINLEEDQSERRLIFPAGGVVVSNGSLHNQILEMISSASPTL